MKPIDIDDLGQTLSWLERFEFYCMTNKEITKENKIFFYLTYIGERAYNLLKDLMYPKELKNCPIESLHNTLVDYVKPTSHTILERVKFNKMVRRDGQKFKEFILEIHQQAAKCEFGQHFSTQMRDRLITGINNKAVEKRLIEEKDLTLEKAKNIIMQCEDMSKEDAEQHNVLKVVKRKWVENKNKLQYKDKGKLEKKPTGKCFSCGGDHFRNKCKFRNATCHKCKKVGHIARVCKQTSVHSTDIQSCLSMGFNADLLYRAVKFINGTNLKFILDTGSTISIISEKLYRKHFSNIKIQPFSGMITAASGHGLPIKGTITLKVVDADTCHWLKFHICSRDLNILGLDSLKILNSHINLQTHS